MTFFSYGSVSFLIMSKGQAMDKMVMASNAVTLKLVFASRPAF